MNFMLNGHTLANLYSNHLLNLHSVLPLDVIKQTNEQIKMCVFYFILVHEYRYLYNCDNILKIIYFSL